VPQVWKQVLSPGVWWTRDPKGNAVPTLFTPERVARYAREGKRMAKKGIPITLPLEHQTGLADPLKKKMADLTKDDRAALAVLNNRGFARDFRIDRMDNSAWALLDIEDDAQFDHISKNVKFVSPRFTPRFTDGEGEEWQDVISHIALTPTPVAFTQKPFGATMEKPIQLSTLFEADQAPQYVDLSLHDYAPGIRPGFPASHASVKYESHMKSHGKMARTCLKCPENLGPVGEHHFHRDMAEYHHAHMQHHRRIREHYQQHFRGTEAAKEASEHTRSHEEAHAHAHVHHLGKQLEHEARHMSGNSVEEDPVASRTEPQGNSPFARCMELLKQVGVTLPKTVSPTNGWDFLEVALTALVQQKSNERKRGEDEPSEEDIMNKAKEEQQPISMSAASLQERVAVLEQLVKDLTAAKAEAEAKVTQMSNMNGRLAEMAATSRFQGLSLRVKQLRQSGRCTPDKQKAWDEKLGAKQMSLVQGGDPEIERVLLEIEFAGEIPEGTFLTEQEKQERQMSTKEAAAPPWGLDFDTAAKQPGVVPTLTEEKVNALLKEAYGDSTPVAAA
jgi:hypothetical protein